MTSQSLPLLMLNGLLCDAALWRHQVRDLSGIVTCHPADTTGHDSVAALARDVLAKAPAQFALVALSMGGYVALEIMRQAPERVLRLCLVNTQARPDTDEQRERRRLLIGMSRAGQFKGVTPRLLPMLIHPDRMQDVDLVDTITAMAERVGRDAFQRQQTAIMNRIDSRPSLKAIRCPVQIISGAQDTLTPPDVMRELAEGIPHARFDVLEHCGHLSPLERPDEVTRIIRAWLG